MANSSNNQSEALRTEEIAEPDLGTQKGPEEIREPDPESRRCRLCAEVGVGKAEDGDSDKWVKITDACLDTNQSIDQFLKESFLRGLLVQLLDESFLQYVCGNCYENLKLLQSFSKKIIKGQEQLRRLFVLNTDKASIDTSNNTLSDDGARRKRGRPRKDPSKPAVMKEVSLSSIEPRSKRPLRPPTRYGSEFYVLDAPNDVSFSNDTQHLREKPKATIEESNTSKSSIPDLETDSLSGITPQVVTDGENVNKGTSKDQAIKFAENKTKNEAEENSELDKNAPPKDKEESVQPEAEDLTDTNFSLKGYYKRSTYGRRRKRGRPKKRKEQVFKCDLCEKVYNAYASLMYHRLSHQNNTQDIQCGLCKKKFAHKGLLANHMFTHSSIKPFLCDFDECNASFRSRGSLYNHKKAVHESITEKRFVCEKCGVKFTFRSALDAHQKIHTGEKPYFCQYCDKRFSHRGNLKEHVRTHTKEKPYACDVGECDKCFTTASQLRDHKMRHLSNKSLLCAECGKTFSQRNALISHMKSHKDDLQVCSICQKNFPDLSALEKHKRIHYVERPFVCNICNKAFADQSNFRKHKSTHRNQKDDSDNAIVDSEETQKTFTPDSALLPFSSQLRADITDSADANVYHPPTTNHPSINEQQRTNNLDSIPIAESFVQILTEEELSALGASVTSSEDGNIIFLYQSNDLFPVSDAGNQTLQVHENVGNVLEEVIPIRIDAVPISQEYQDGISPMNESINN